MSIPALVLLLILAALAAARLTRLVTTDSVTDSLRDAIGRRWHLNGSAYTLVTCPWCIGFWISAAVVGSGVWALHAHHVWWWATPAAALAVSHLVGLAAAIDDD